MGSVVDRQIVIRSSPQGFVVDVEPVVEGRNYSASHGTIKEAWGYVGGLRLTHGWPVIDLIRDDTGATS